MKKSNKIIAMIISVAMVFSVFASINIVSFADTASEIVLDAPDTALYESVTVTISAYGITGLESTDLELYYDPAYLDYVGIEELSDSIDIAASDMVPGNVNFSCVFSNAYATDSDTLYSVTFNVMKAGNTEISLVVVSWEGADIPNNATADIAIESRPYLRASDNCCIAVNYFEKIVTVNEKTEVSAVISSIANESISVLSAEGFGMATNEFIGTGCSVICDGMEYKVVVPADVDGSGKISAADARVALRVSARLDVVSDIQMLAADMDNDTNITASDARSILRVSAAVDKLPEIEVAVTEPTTEEPTTEEPTTEEPTTEEPTTEEPTTEEPTTEEPTTEEPTTEEPTTEEPTTEEPTTEEPTTEEPTTEEPTTEEPTTEEPTTEEPTTEEPTSEEPTTEEPTSDEPTSEEPTSEEPTTEEPTSEEPTSDEPTSEEPTTDEPATDEPTSEEPTTDEPVTDEPVTDEPVTDDSTDSVLEYPSAIDAFFSGKFYAEMILDDGSVSKIASDGKKCEATMQVEDKDVSIFTDGTNMYMKFPYLGQKYYVDMKEFESLGADFDVDTMVSGMAFGTVENYGVPVLTTEILDGVEYDVYTFTCENETLMKFYADEKGDIKYISSLDAEGNMSSEMKLNALSATIPSEMLTISGCKSGSLFTLMMALGT